MSDDDGWARFGAALAGELARLPDEAILLIREPGRDDHFAQFVLEADQLRAEVAGDLDAAGNPGALSVRDQRLLAAEGWQPPKPGGRDPNWWQTVDWPATSGEYQHLADAVVTALRDVREISSPRVLVARSWEFGGRRREVSLPGVAADPD